MIYSAPSYLSGMVTEVNEVILSKIQKEYGNNTTAFKVINKFNELIISWNGEYNEYGGRVWGVDMTKNKQLVYDQFKHGYNGLMQLNEEDDISSTKVIDLPQVSDIIIAFQYSGDETEYIEDGTSEFAQDYFGWIAIYKHSESGLEEIISFECA